jgi:hypothetical protein
MAKLPFPGYKELTLSQAANQIKNADNLLFRSKGATSRFIRTYTGNPHSHAAKTSWANGQLELAEVREFRGGRIVTLASQVQNYPGHIDVYRSNAINLKEWSDEEWYELYCRSLNGQRDQAVRYKHLIQVVAEHGQGRYCRQGANLLMRGFAGCAYGWGAILKTGVCNLPGLRFYFSPNYDDTQVNKYPPYCSAAVAIADRLGGGFDQVRARSDSQTTPGDLARSPFNDYLFTLIPDPEE